MSALLYLSMISIVSHDSMPRGRSSSLVSFENTYDTYRLKRTYVYNQLHWYYLATSTIKSVANQLSWPFVLVHQYMPVR